MLTIKDAQGRVVWDLESYKQFIGDDKPSPDTVNPSLWRNAQLNLHYGLFEVVPGIYQVRGYDLSNITFVQGKTGWIVGDPLISAETARAAFDLVTEQFGKKPIHAVIYSHSHVATTAASAASSTRRTSPRRRSASSRRRASWSTRSART
jgi:alkyl sulfatase BDS1-like metallo-beta-lactamase superfamily hydrolase